MPPTHDQLDDLARRVQGGDHEAFVALVEATERDLRIFLTCYASSLAMVDEVLQGAYATAFESIARYELRGTLRTWLKGIARNLLLRELTERTRTQALDVDALDAALARDGAAALAEEQHEEREQRFARLRHCLERLAPEARRLVQERYYEDRPVAEIAGILTRTQSWVAVTLFRVRKVLGECLRAGGAA